MNYLFTRLFLFRLTRLTAGGMSWLLFLLLTQHTNAQTAPASITISGSCLGSTYVLNKAYENYEGTNRPAYVGSGTVTVGSTTTQTTITVYYQVPAPGPVWVMAFDGGVYLSNSSTSTVPPTSGWVVVDNSGGFGNCNGTGPLTVVSGTLALSPATSGPVCAGTTVNLTATTTNLASPVTYAWRSSPAGISGSGSNSVIGLNTSGVTTTTTFAITVTATSGTSSATATASVSVNATPGLVAGTAVNPTGCGAATGSIPFTTTNLPNGTYSLSYSGVGSPKMVTVANNAFTLSGLTVGTYSSFSITNAGCTGSTATSKTLTGPTVPALALTTASSLCAGQSVMLTATSGFNSYTFTGSSSPVSSGAANTATVPGLLAGSYSFSVAATAPNGCTNTALASVTINPLPVPTLTASGTVTCTQLSQTLTGGGGTTYTFTGPAGTLPGSGSTRTVSTGGLYSVTVTNASGCSATTSLTVSEDKNAPAPSAAITSTQNFSTCQNSGTSVMLIASCASGLYKWSDNSTMASVSILSSVAGSFPYSVSCVSASGCLSTGVSATATVKPKPAAPTFTAPAQLVVCEPATLTVGVTSTGTPALTVTRLFMGNTTSSITASTNISLSLPGSYTLSGYTTLNGCQSDAATPLTGLSINPQPTPSGPITSPQSFTSYANGPAVTLTASCASGLYQWSDNSTMASVTVPSSATGSFPYSVSCVSTSGCRSTGVSATATIAPNAPPVLNVPFAPLSTTVGENFRFQVAANAFTDPEGGTLTYAATGLPSWLSFAASTRTFSGSVTTAGSFTITVTATDPLGASTSAPLAIDVSPLPAGFYLLPPLYNCATGAFTFRVSGADRTPILYWAEGITPGSSNPSQLVSAALRAAPGVITIYAKQRGVTVSRTVDLSSYCNPPTPSARAAAPGLPEVPLTLTVQGNPVTDGVLRAEVRGAEGQPLQISLTDLNGRSVATKRIESAGVVEPLNLAVGPQSAGLLILRISTPGQSRSQKIINQ